ncbi:MAG TPA: BamA/TamA family outer membrane protein [Thermohalobaculum sp.]|nr:BamA/TamA family outer membrane protein [Thermohalobaculum sp.]
MQAPVPFRRCPRGASLRFACLALAVMAAGCSGNRELFPAAEFERPETTVNYEAVLEGAPSDDFAELAEASLATWRYMEDGAPSPAFLRRRAEDDVETLLKILRSRGYYAGSVETAVEETGPGEARVTFSIAPGPAFTLTRHDFVVSHEGPIAPPALDAAGLGSPVGEQARAAAIAEAEAAAVGLLKRRGFAYAGFQGRSGLADPEAATLVVDSRIAAGRAHVFGEVSFEGVESVEEDYLRTYLPWAPGETFDTEKLRTYQQRLFATELFDGISVRLPEASPGEEALPITVVADERLPRTVAGGLRYDTDLGPSARVSFEHRNLFGRNERFRAEAEAGLIEQRLGLGLRKPQFLRHGQDIVGDITFTRTDDEAFEALSVTAFAGLEREISRRGRGGLGVLAEASRIDDDGDEGTALLLGVPFFAAYDGSDDLLNPTTGGRFRFNATPFGGTFEGAGTQFLVLDARGSYYQPLDEARDYVLAGRGRVATILAPGLERIPPTRRLYSGGGGSVRGYRERFIGPLDADNDPVGGRSALEAGVELRVPIWDDIGGVVFTEAGSVSTEMFPDFAEGIQVAAGVGLRYHTLAGPVRLDVGVPLNPRGADDAFQVYFSIGQAF